MIHCVGDKERLLVNGIAARSSLTCRRNKLLSKGLFASTGSPQTVHRQARSFVYPCPTITPSSASQHHSRAIAGQSIVIAVVEPDLAVCKDGMVCTYQRRYGVHILQRGFLEVKRLPWTRQEEDSMPEFCIKALTAPLVEMIDWEHIADLPGGTGQISEDIDMVVSAGPRISFEYSHARHGWLNVSPLGPGAICLPASRWSLPS